MKVPAPRQRSSCFLVILISLISAEDIQVIIIHTLHLHSEVRVQLITTDVFTEQKISVNSDERLVMNCRCSKMKSTLAHLEEVKKKKQKTRCISAGREAKGNKKTKTCTLKIG